MVEKASPLLGFFVEPGYVDQINLGYANHNLLIYPDGRCRFMHECDRGKRGRIICAPLLSPEHSVGGTTRDVMVNPSILCPDCGTHGFIQHSNWIAA